MARNYTSHQEWFEDDPVGYLKAQQDSILNAMNAFAQQQAQAAQMQQLQAQVARQAKQFAAQRPDYADALKHVVDGRRKEYKAFGLTDEQLDAALESEVGGLIRAEVAAGRNPAETMYTYAKSRGFESAPSNILSEISDEDLDKAFDDMRKADGIADGPFSEPIFEEE
ncbi:MAG: hypothetical protein AB1344_06270 [Pseudomonadota bacterium]